MTKVLLAILLVLVMMGISMENKAEASGVKLNSRDVICATLAFNAGYEAQGEWYFRNRIEAHFDAQKERIRMIVDITHNMIGDIAEESGEHPVQVYRDKFNDKCMAPFA